MEELQTTPDTSVAAQTWEHGRNLVVSPLKDESQRARLGLDEGQLSEGRTSANRATVFSCGTTFQGQRENGSSLVALSTKRAEEASITLQFYDDVRRVVKATGCVFRETEKAVRRV